VFPFIPLNNGQLAQFRGGEESALRGGEDPAIMAIINTMDILQEALAPEVVNQFQDSPFALANHCDIGQGRPHDTIWDKGWMDTAKDYGGGGPLPYLCTP